MNHFNICPSCMHRSTCVLTAQKDKVWSCSEYDETPNIGEVSNSSNTPKQKNEHVLELV